MIVISSLISCAAAAATARSFRVSRSTPALWHTLPGHSSCAAGNCFPPTQQLKNCCCDRDRLPSRLCVEHRNQAVASGLRCALGARRQLAIQRRDELLNLTLHLAHLFAHVENNLHAREIHAEIAREMQNHLEPLDVLGRVKPRVAFAARRLEQAFTLVQTQRLRMNLVLLGDRRDHVGGFGFRLAHQTLLQISARGSSGCSFAISRSNSRERSSVGSGVVSETSTI